MQTQYMVIFLLISVEDLFLYRSIIGLIKAANYQVEQVLAFIFRQHMFWKCCVQNAIDGRGVRRRCCGVVEARPRWIIVRVENLKTNLRRCTSDLSHAKSAWVAHRQSPWSEVG